METQLEQKSQTELFRKIKREKDIDVLAIVTSSWHYLSALSTIAWLKRKKGVGKSIILVFEHPTDGYIIEPKLVMKNWFQDVETYCFKFGALASNAEVRKYLLHHEKDGKEFYILRPVMPKLEFSVKLYNEKVRKNIVHIVIEEGMATYMRDWKGWMFEEVTTCDIAEVWKKLGERIWKKEAYRIMLAKRGEYIENILFVKRGKSFVQNRRAISYFKKILEKAANIYDLSSYKNYENSVIICTQTYGEQGRILKNDDIEVLKRLCRAMQGQGWNVIVKPHPREKNMNKYETLECEIDRNSSVPLESIFAGLSVKPRCVVGITTTTLVTAKLFWNIPAISIAKLINPDAYTKKIVGEVDSFCKIFGNMLEIPEDFKGINFEKLEHSCNEEIIPIK